jgi:hypothetical protein
MDDFFFFNPLSKACMRLCARCSRYFLCPHATGFFGR